MIRLRLHQLDISNGCQAHTVLPYAPASFVSRAGDPSRGSTRPVTAMHTNALASTTSHPTFVTTRDRPSCRERTGRAGRTDLPDKLSEILPDGLFCRSGVKKTRTVAVIDSAGFGQAVTRLDVALAARARWRGVPSRPLGRSHEFVGVSECPLWFVRADVASRWSNRR